jgi:hypothetical protein
MFSYLNYMFGYLNETVDWNIYPNEMLATRKICLVIRVKCSYPNDIFSYLNEIFSYPNKMFSYPNEMFGCLNKLFDGRMKCLAIRLKYLANPLKCWATWIKCLATRIKCLATRMKCLATWIKCKLREWKVAVTVQEHTPRCSRHSTLRLQDSKIQVTFHTPI